MDVYIYQADVYCEPDGLAIRDRLDEGGSRPADPGDESSYDSDDYPKGPYPDGGGESDTPQHCAVCGLFLENPLTSDGLEYVKEFVLRDLREGQTDSNAVEVWAPFYGLHIPEGPASEEVETFRPSW